MVEVRVPNLDCEGCASKLKKALFKLKGTICILFCFFYEKNVPYFVWQWWKWDK